MRPEIFIVVNAIILSNTVQTTAREQELTKTAGSLAFENLTLWPSNPNL